MIGPEIFGFGPWCAEIIGFKEVWGQQSPSGPRKSFKVGQVSSNSIFPIIFCDNKVSVYIAIGKLTTWGFQNTPESPPNQSLIFMRQPVGPFLMPLGAFRQTGHVILSPLYYYY